MATIKDVVNVNIDLSAVSAIKSENFNLLLALGTHTVFTEVYREYSDPNQLLTDGFKTDSAEYVLATRAFNYDSPVPKIYIGRRLVSEINVSVEVLRANFEYYTTIDGVKYTYSKATTPTAIEVATGLVTEMAADPVVDVVDGLDGTYTITPKVVGTAFSATYDVNQIPVSQQVGNDIVTDVEAIKAEVNDWFAIMETLRVKSEVLELATWCENERKLFVTVSNEAEILDTVANDTTSIAYTFLLNQYKFATVIYHDNLTDYIDAAWFGEELRKDAGASQWALKNLPGIVPDSLTDAQRVNVLDKRCNVYELIGGLGVTNQGTVPNLKYRFIDIVRDLEWLKVDIQVAMFQVLVDTGKIPYTNAGTGILENHLIKRLTLAVEKNILASDPAPVTIVPLVKDIPVLDRENRILKNLNWTATLTNAIIKIDITGTVTY